MCSVRYAIRHPILFTDGFANVLQLGIHVLAVAQDFLVTINNACTLTLRGHHWPHFRILSFTFLFFFDIQHYKQRRIDGEGKNRKEHAVCNNATEKYVCIHYCTSLWKKWSAQGALKHSCLR